MNPMFNEYKDAGKIQEALLIGRNMVNKAPGDSECVNAYLDFLLMLAEKLPRTDERKSFADQANLVLSFYEENADLTDDIINDIHVYHNRLGAVVTDSQHPFTTSSFARPVLQEGHQLIGNSFSYARPSLNIFTKIHCVHL